MSNVNRNAALLKQCIRAKKFAKAVTKISSLYCKVEQNTILMYATVSIMAENDESHEDGVRDIKKSPSPLNK